MDQFWKLSQRSYLNGNELRMTPCMSSYDLKFPFLSLSKNPHQQEAPSLRGRRAPFLVVGPKSPLSWLKAIEGLAYFAKRELGYDFPLYSADERLDEERQRDRILIFYRQEIKERQPSPRNPKDFINYYSFLGAIGVRWREWENAEASWSVSWVWLHPYERRHGRLTEAWPFLVEMFPDACIERPVSEAMAAFLKKTGHTHEIV